MEAQGSDAILRVDDSNLTIVWTSLRGRLGSITGADLEVIPLSKIFDHALVPASENKKGCFQLRTLMSGNPANPIHTYENWLEPLARKEISYAVLFNNSQHLSFVSFSNYLAQILEITKRKIRNSTPYSQEA